MNDLEFDQLLPPDRGCILNEHLLNISINLVIRRPACRYNIHLLTLVGIIYHLNEESSLIADGVGRHMINGLNEIVLDHTPLKFRSTNPGQRLRLERLEGS